MKIATDEIEESPEVARHPARAVGGKARAATPSRMRGVGRSPPKLHLRAGMAEKYSRHLLFCPDGDWEKWEEWTGKWRILRNRHPFFLCDEMREGSSGFLEVFSAILPNITEDIDVIVNSLGGDMEESFRAPYLFQTFCPKYAAVVPRLAKSGATLFSLGASEILMGRWAELGPLDPQVLSPSNDERRYFSSPESALESFHALKFAQKEVTEYLDAFFHFLIKRGISGRHAVREAKELIEATIGRIYANVSPFELGSSGRILEVMEKYCLKIMQANYKKDDIPRISHQLVWGYPDHRYFIDRTEARSLGLHVKDASDEEQALLDELGHITSNFEARCLGTLIPKEHSDEEAHDDNTEEEAHDDNTEEEAHDDNTEEEAHDDNTEEEGREEQG